jgi:hypothetical protein
MTQRSMTFTWISDDFVMVVDHRDSLDDDDVDSLLRSLAGRTFGAQGLRILVFNAGGAPNAAQRARFERQLRGKPMRIAVICTSTFTRMVVKAFHLLGFLNVAPFAPDQERDAFLYLSLTAAEVARVRDQLVAQRRRYAAGDSG